MHPTISMSSATSSNGKGLLPSIKPTIKRSRATKPGRRARPRTRSTNVKPKKRSPRTVVLDDDPPKQLPPGYKSPASLVRYGDQIQVYWEGDQQFYAGTAKNLREDGRHRVEYDDGEVMYHALCKEVIIFEGRSLEAFLANAFPEAAEQHCDDSPTPYPGLARLVTIGCIVKVYLHNYKKYCQGRVDGKDTRGRFLITFEDGRQAALFLEEETFRFVGLSAAHAYANLF